jgi:hypothetical protein
MLTQMINDNKKSRPDDIAPSNWKNRFHVNAKLTPINHKAFLEFCKQNNYNYSSGINNLIANYLLKHNV